MNAVKSVYTTPDVLMLGHLRNLLANEEIDCEVRTPFLAAAQGELPVLDCWSELRIRNDADLEKALGVIRKALAPLAEARGSWTCARCGEAVEDQFEACWQCESARPG